MAGEEEAHDHHGFAHGHHPGKTGEHKDKDRALYWSLGLGAAGLVVAVLLFMNSGSSKKPQPGTNTVVQPSQDFIPNPTDVSIGSNAAPLFWPALPTSGTPSHPKTHHSGDSDDDDKKKKKKTDQHSNKSNDHKGYGTSPKGNTHSGHSSGHKVSEHNTTHPTAHGHMVKGKQNG